jgi:hypothetical protein
MIQVLAVVLPAGVVKEGEKPHHGQVGPTAFCDVEAKGVDSLPVAWPVNGINPAPENGDRVFPNPSYPRGGTGVGP